MNRAVGSALGHPELGDAPVAVATIALAATEAGMPHNMIDPSSVIQPDNDDTPAGRTNAMATAEQLNRAQPLHRSKHPLLVVQEEEPGTAAETHASKKLKSPTTDPKSPPVNLPLAATDHAEKHPEDDDNNNMAPVLASTVGISSFGENDVLCGRGGGTNVHPGNRNFRDLINLHRRTYLKARKNDKPAISRAIVRSVRESDGKFLKRDDKSGLWFEIGDDAAREKTSQALRQRAPEMRKLLFDTEAEESRLGHVSSAPQPQALPQPQLQQPRPTQHPIALGMPGVTNGGGPMGLPTTITSTHSVPHQALAFNPAAWMAMAKATSPGNHQLPFPNWATGGSPTTTTMTPTPTAAEMWGTYHQLFSNNGMNSFPAPPG